MYSFFETVNALYKIYNGEYLKHLKEWDNISGFRYYFVPVSIKEYNHAWLIHESTVK